MKTTLICLILFTQIITADNFDYLHNNVKSGSNSQNQQGEERSLVPNWAKGIVWYQIFPERFDNGDISNDPTSERVFSDSKNKIDNWEVTSWSSNWFAQDEWMKESKRTDVYLRRYGGDIQGVINRLDYLKELGVGAIYLNPVFDAVSLHKYDGSTFHHIDINFGPNPNEDEKIISSEIPHDSGTWEWSSADKLFLQLIKEVHKRNMKIIIDGIFNHTGRNFWAFKDIAEKGENSLYKNWYRINSFDDPSTEKNEFDYKGWWNIASLPEINRTENDLHPEPKKYIFEITKRWMDPNGDGNTDDGIDGWRLDVAREVPIGFWNDWSNLVKSINKEAVIIGELWELSPDFVGANKPFDGLMNYNFAFAVNDFFIADKNKIKRSDLIANLKEITNTYPEDNLHALQNLVDSHDTERISSIIKNPDRNYDRDGNSGNENYDPSKPNSNEYQKQKLIAAFQMTYLGAPMIYYGDEVGMWGADDPHCRKPMVWDDKIYDDEMIDENSGFKKGFGSYKVFQNKDLLSTYKKLIAIRNSSKTLQIGSVEFLTEIISEKLFGFTREFENEKIYVIFNLSDKEEILELPSNNYMDLYNNFEIKSNNKSLILVPNSFVILKEI
ncbi:MAG: glycoside hydrolase family 13 protein [Melioribacteraceae bacterium]|nr:glycoside hydrolase family 13 protein [Melioribacteraceae bacterium]